MLTGLAGSADWRPLLMALVPALLLAWLAARGARRLATAAMRALLRDALVQSSPLVRAPLRLVSAGVFLLVLALVLFPALELAGVRVQMGLQIDELKRWAFNSGLKIVLIVLLAFALIRTTTLLVKRFEYEVTQGTGLDALERAKRARTLGAVVSKVATILVSTVAVLMVLHELRIDITPVLTGAGIAGLAVGFGAQTLVRDVISGFFLILEDQVRVGDVAAINGTGGLVEEINLRTIILRDFEGTVHVFPNGAINTLANRSKEFSYYVIDLPISYREDPDRVTALLRDVGSELQQDPLYTASILGPIEIHGVDAFTEWATVLKLRIKTVPLKQWEVGRELRKRIRKTLAQHGVEVPYPERVVTVREGEPMKPPAVRSST